MAHYLICYDIANPKRLGKVHRCAVKHALFVQYSIYYLEGNKVKLQAMLDELQMLIKQDEDDIRAYTITPLKEAIQLGQSWLPDDLVLV